MTQPMPAISLWQPYATLIAIGIKPFETRRWKPPERLVGRRIAIHAAKRVPSADDLQIVADACDKAYLLPDRLDYGAVVCTALLYGWYKVKQSPRGDRPGELSGYGSFWDDGLGDYSEGRFCWHFSQIEPFDPPIPAKGDRGFWQWDPQGADQ